MSETTLALLLYLVVGVSIIFYVALDGFDLGVGMLHLFSRKDQDRRIFLNAIGPVWDGNEVWLVIVGGALFAGFPDVYAALFSGFYNLCMILLAGLIFRAVAIEFRSKRNSMSWRHTWDTIFCFASFVIAFGLGIAFGNLIEGVPLNENRDVIQEGLSFFRPYSLLVGLFTVTLLMMHGSVFLAMKTEGELHDCLRKWVKRCVVSFIPLYILTTIATWVYVPRMVERFFVYPWTFIVPVLSVLAILGVPKAFSKGKDGLAFICSCLAIFFLFLVFGIGTFPYLVFSTLSPEQNSLSFYNASSSPLTLKVLLIIVAIGVPFVLAYGAMIYRIFRGKVKIGPMSY